MHFRRLACLLLGAWFGGSVLSALILSQEISSADRLAADLSPQAAVVFNSTGREMARELFRYQASDTMRRHLELWENLQLVLGIGVLLVLLFGTHESKIPILTAAAMLLLLSAQRFVVTPEIGAIGRLLDFIPSGAGSTDRAKLLVLRSAWTGLEIAKGLGVLILLARLLPRRSSSGDAGGKLDGVNKADHRHVNR